MTDTKLPTRSLWMLPTLTFRDIRFFTIALVIVLSTVASVTDPDLWWHLRTGEFILDEHRFPSTDPFAWTTSGRTWYLHEWLSEVIIYAVTSSIGFFAMVAITAATIIAALSIVYRLSLRICSRELVVFGIIIVTTAMMLEFTKVRPQAFTWLFFAIFLRQLYGAYREEGSALWPLPALMVVWSNMHLGYLFGLMTIYIWLFAMFVRERPTLEKLRTPLIVTALATLAPAVSPLGPRALLVPFGYLGNSNVAFSGIQEWASPNFHIVTFLPVIIGIGVLFTTGLPLGRRNVFGLVLALVLMAAALISRRNIPFFALILPVVAAESIALRWPGQLGASRVGSQRLNWAFAGFLTIIAIATLPYLGNQLHSDPKVRSNLPSDGVAYLNEHALGERMFNTYDWGGYLIHELYPDTKVSIDGRSDLYGDGLLRQYQNVVAIRPSWQDDLRKLNPDFILIPKNSALALRLREEPDWMLAFEGDVEAIFVRPQD